MEESLKRQMEDSDIIFNQITSSGLTSFQEAEFYIANFWIPDTSVSRAGISHALRRLERHYSRVPRELER